MNGLCVAAAATTQPRFDNKNNKIKANFVYGFMWRDFISISTSEFQTFPSCEVKGGYVTDMSPISNKKSAGVRFAISYGKIYRC